MLVILVKTFHVFVKYTYNANRIQMYKYKCRYPNCCYLNIQSIRVSFVLFLQGCIISTRFCPVCLPLRGSCRADQQCQFCLAVISRCTLNPSDQLAMEGPLSRVKSIKKSLRQSFRRIRRSRVSLRKHHVNNAAKVPGNPAEPFPSPHLSDALHLQP